MKRLIASIALFVAGIAVGTSLNYKAMREADGYAKLQSDVAVSIADDLTRCEGRLDLTSQSLQICVEARAKRTGIETANQDSMWSIPNGAIDQSAKTSIRVLP